LYRSLVHRGREKKRERKEYDDQLKKGNGLSAADGGRPSHGPAEKEGGKKQF